VRRAALGLLLAGLASAAAVSGACSRSSPSAAIGGPTGTGQSAGVGTSASSSSSPPSGSQRLPPAPPIPASSLGPDAPPLVWVGGALISIDQTEIQVQEGVGSRVTVELLGANATTFYRPSGGAWASVPRPAVSTGQPACVEALLAKPALLALRVFLGASCGPS
jgi:hypothetical protein